MPLNTSPLLPRAASAPDRLQHLREQAFSRLLAEEAALTPLVKVTRRWALGRMALAAGAVAAGLHRRAFAAPGPRSTAPQYGAPGIYGNTDLPKPTSFAGRDDLGSLAAWKRGYGTVIKSKGKNSGYVGYGASDSLSTLYYMPSIGDPILMSLVTDQPSGFSYVVPASQTFYVHTGVDMVGLRWGTDELILTPSLFGMKTPEDGEAGVLANFSTLMDDRALQRAAAPKRATHISLASAIPPGEWQLPFVMYAYVEKGIFTIGTANNRSFTFDLQARKLIKYDPGGHSYR